MSRLFFVLAACIALAASAFVSSASFTMLTSSVRETKEPRLITSRWGKTLNAEGAIPEDGFKAFYFVSGSMTKPVFSEQVSGIAIKYAWDEFHGIKSEDFAGYWVGRVSVAAPTTKRISVSQSWSRSRILIDGEVVFDSDADSEREFDHHFSAGSHVVEVEFENNWHTVEYKVTIGDVVEKVGKAEVSRFFENEIETSTRLHLVSLYESGSKDTSVEVDIPGTGNPVALWLTSYEAIEWKINSSDPIAAVVLSSHSPGSRVSGTAAPVLLLDRWDALYSETPRCSCVANMYRCEDGKTGGLDSSARELQGITGLPLAGYAIKYSAKTVTTQLYDEAVIEELRRQREAALNAAQQCSAKTDFEPR